MRNWISSIGLALALLAPLGLGQEPKKADEGKAQPGAAKKKKAQPVVDIGKKKDEQVRVLRPRDIPKELVRLKSKADIKSEITIRTSSGRPVTFKGVIRNGKLIERIVKKRFVPEKDLKKPHCGVRVWWAGNTDGFIFFRYSVIKSLKITGKLTAAERREIMRRLRDKRAGKTEGSKQPATGEKVGAELAEMSPEELKAYLLKRYPYAEGWNHKKMRALKRKKLIDNKPLTREEEIFVKYFSILVEAHFEDLKKSTKKIEIEPNSDSESDDAESDKIDEQPAGGG